MELRELKNKILAQEALSFPLLFINYDNGYLIKSYVKKIAENNSLTIKEIESIKEMVDIESGMFKEADYLYIYNLNKDDNLSKEQLKDYKIILISDTDRKDSDIEKVVFNKLENWQIEAYVQALLPGLDNQEVSWLCKNAKYDIWRLDNEASKLNIFDKKDQSKILMAINDDNGYVDLNELTIFNLSNAIMNKDMLGIKKVVEDIDNIDVEGTGLVTILLKNFLNIINIQTNSKATAQSLGMSEKQFRYLQYNQCNKYSNEELFNIYNFLTDIDYKLKSGLLEMTNNQLNYYVLSHIIK